MDTPTRHQLVSSVLAGSDTITKSAAVASQPQREVLAACVPGDMTKQSSVTSLSQILAAAETAQS